MLFKTITDQQQWHLKYKLGTNTKKMLKTLLSCVIIVTVTIS